MATSNRVYADRRGGEWTLAFIILNVGGHAQCGTARRVGGEVFWVGGVAAVVFP
jgi:hypothetical protein